MSFKRDGEAYSLTKKGLQMFKMLSNPALEDDEVGNKSFPPLVPNLVEDNTFEKWSAAMWSPVTEDALELELPDWDDYGFRDLYNEFKKRCKAHQLNESQAEDLKQKMLEAVEKQKDLYRTLNTIKESLDTDKKPKLIQQKEELEALLKIWRKRIKKFEPLIAPLDYKDCLRPPITVNIAMGYWDCAILNPTDAINTLTAAGIIDRLQAFPKAVISITATYDHGGVDDYTDDPTAFLDKGYTDKQRQRNNIPDSIVERRDYLSVKAQNVADLITSISGIEKKQVQPNLTPGDTGPHMGAGGSFGNQVDLNWINDGE